MMAAGEGSRSARADRTGRPGAGWIRSSASGTAAQERARHQSQVRAEAVRPLQARAERGVAHASYRERVQHQGVPDAQAQLALGNAHQVACFASLHPPHEVPNQPHLLHVRSRASRQSDAKQLPIGFLDGDALPWCGKHLLSDQSQIAQLFVPPPHGLNGPTTSLGDRLGQPTLIHADIWAGVWRPEPALEEVGQNRGICGRGPTEDVGEQPGRFLTPGDCLDGAACLSELGELHGLSPPSRVHWPCRAVGRRGARQSGG